MSKYTGRLEGKFDFIAVDNFTRETVNLVSVFFLSHYHSDHFQGLRYLDLDRQEAINTFRNNPEKKLYCSFITRQLFLNDDRSRIPENQIVGVNVGETVIVTNMKKDCDEPICVAVTLIPSGHILGAVMLLFEHENERALFTGDFRIYPDDIPKLKALHHSNSEVKTITHLYLDTTFGTLKYPTFPLRSKISQLAVNLISGWLSSGYVVHIDLPYQFAFEKLILDISKGLGCKIAVDHAFYKTYAYIPELDNCVYCAYGHNTTDKYKLHACARKRVGKDCVFCSIYENNKVKVIRPCAQTFTKQVLLERLTETGCTQGCEITRIPYSTHCSLEELQAFVRYLNPKEVISIVNHKMLDFNEVIENVLSLVKKSDVPRSILASSNSKITNLQFLIGCDSSEESAEEYNVPPAMDSPPW